MNCDFDVTESVVSLLTSEKIYPSIMLDNLMEERFVPAGKECREVLSRYGIWLNDKGTFMEHYGAYSDGGYYEDESRLTMNTLLKFLNDNIFYDLDKYFYITY